MGGRSGSLGDVFLLFSAMGSAGHCIGLPLYEKRFTSYNGFPADLLTVH